MTDPNGERGPCVFGDPTCPCQDGHVCHYVATKDTPAMRPPGVCPSCGFTGRQANEWRGGILVRSCRDPWHHAPLSGGSDAS
jgi:RNA polymerase subunit RPABC4/transcription elongation factor Spt4